MLPIYKTERAQLQCDFDALAAITEPGRPWTRRSFTPMFLQGRRFLEKRFAEEGVSVRVDAAGNLIGRWQGAQPGTSVLMTGSHSDTVPSGGRFDGIAGVLSGTRGHSCAAAGGLLPVSCDRTCRFPCRRAERMGLVLRGKPWHRGRARAEASFSCRTWRPKPR